MDPPTRHQRRSASQVTSYSKCGYQYYLERVVKVPRRPTWWFAGGRAFAETKETIETMMADASGKQWPSTADAERVYVGKLAQEVARVAGETETDPDTWAKAQQGSEDGAWWFREGARMAALYIERNPVDRPFKTLVMPDGKLALEVEFAHAFGNVNVTGFIDQLTLDKHGYVDVVDDKTGKVPEDPLQLDMYAMAAEHHYGVSVARTNYYMARPIGPKAARQDHMVTRPWVPGVREDAVIDRIARMDAAERAGVYLPVVSNLCKGCGVRAACPYGGTASGIPN